MIKKVLFTSSALVILYFFTKSQTDGFSEENIYQEPSSNFSEERFFSYLTQPFLYFGHGTQSFALLSEDGQYVLKFFRNDRSSHPLKGLRSFLPPFAKNRLQKTLEKRTARRLKAFSSYQIAFASLREETGLLALQLPSSPPCNQTLAFRDKIGILHHFKLINTPFLLQRKASAFYPTLLMWINQNKTETARNSLSALISLLKSRCEKGIFDKDPNLETNFGWLGDRPIQVDVGRFSLDATRKDPAIYREDLIRITHPLRLWLGKVAPDLDRHLQEELNAL